MLYFNIFAGRRWPGLAIMTGIFGRVIAISSTSAEDTIIGEIEASHAARAIMPPRYHYSYAALIFCVRLCGLVHATSRGTGLRAHARSAAVSPRFTPLSGDGYSSRRMRAEDATISPSRMRRGRRRCFTDA